MAQVNKTIQKFEQGGAHKGKSTTASSAPKSYGKFVLDGEERDVTDDLINQFGDWLSTQTPETQRRLVDVRRRLQSGQLVDFDSHSGELGAEVELEFKNDTQRKRQTLNRRKSGMFLDALFGNNVHKNAVAIDALRGFKYQEPVSMPEASPQPTNVKFTRHDVEYNPAKGGLPQTYATSPLNAAAWNRMQQFIDYRGMDGEERKSWNLSGFDKIGSAEDLLAVTTDDDIRNAWKRVETDSATDNDWHLLNRFNIWHPKQSVPVPEGAQTPEQGQDAVENAISNHGLNVELANQYGIGLNEDMSLDFSRLDKDKVYLFSGYGPISKGEFYGGAYYNNKAYTKEEAESSPELIELLAPYRAQIAKGIYNDTANVVHNWGVQVSPERYNPSKEYYKEFHDVLQPVDGKFQHYFWLNQAYDVDTDAGEQMISVPDYESGTNPLTGYTNKLKYHTYSPQTGLTTDHSPMRQLRETLDTAHQYVKPTWGRRYLKGQRHALIADRDGYKFYVGEKDKAWYVERGDSKDYYVVQDPAVALRIMRGESVTEDEVTDMLKGRNTVFGGRSTIGKLVYDNEGYRNVRGSLRNIGGPSQQQWALYLKEIAQERAEQLGTNTDGSPRKYQYGGALRTVRPVQAGRIEAKKELDVSIRDPRDPKVLGDGRGLSGNDKLEIAAIVSDLAGLGLTFVPGAGNIAGGVTGVAGTGMQFTADVNRDGLDWGDVGRGAMNLGLDALTFIPGLGSASKAVKVAKTIRRAGTSVLKALALASAGNAAYTSAKKFINNEKWTIDDLKIVAAGLQGGVASGRAIKAQVKAGKHLKRVTNAEIAVKNKGIIDGAHTTKKTALKGVDADAKEVTKNIELSMTKAEVTQYNALDGDAARNKFLADKVKTQSDFSVTADQASTLREDFGLPKDKAIGYKKKKITTQKAVLKGDVWSKEMPNWQAYNQVSRGVNVKNKSAKNIAIETTQPALNFALNRRAIIGSAKYPSLGPAKLWTVGQSPWRTLQIPRFDRDSNKALERYEAWENQFQEYKEGGKILKYQWGDKFRRLEELSTPNHWRRSVGWDSFNSPYSAESGIPASNWRPVETPIREVRITATDGRNWAPQTNTYADMGTLRSGLVPNNWQSVGDAIPTINSAAPDSQKNLPQTASKTVVIKKPPYTTGHFSFPQIGLDPDNTMAIGSLALALGRNNKQARVMKRGIRTAMGALESAPLEILPRFTDHGVFSAYENAAQQQLGIKPATSDYLQSYAIEQDAKNKAEQLRLEGRLKTSEVFSNYLDKSDELKRNYAGMRMDVSNRNRQRMAQLNMALAETESGRLANQYASWNNFIMEKRDRFANDQRKFEGYQDALTQNKLKMASSKNYNEVYNKAVATFNALPPEVRKLHDNDINTYLKNNPAILLNLQNAISSFDAELFTEGANQNMKYHRLSETEGDREKGGWGILNNLFGTFHTNPPKSPRIIARGGKIAKNKSHSLNATERIWMNQNKDIAQAVKQIHKNVITLFLKATS